MPRKRKKARKRKSPQPRRPPPEDRTEFFAAHAATPLRQAPCTYGKRGRIQPASFSSSFRDSHLAFFFVCGVLLFSLAKGKMFAAQSLKDGAAALSVGNSFKVPGRRTLGAFPRRQPGICEKRLLILVNKNSRRPISKPCLSRKASSAEIDMPPRRPQAFVRGGNKTTAVFGAVPSGKNQHEFFTGTGASPSDQTVPEKLPPFSPLGEGGDTRRNPRYGDIKKTLVRNTPLREGG